MLCIEGSIDVSGDSVQERLAQHDAAEVVGAVDLQVRPLSPRGDRLRWTPTRRFSLKRPLFTPNDRSSRQHASLFTPTALFSREHTSLQTSFHAIRLLFTPTTHFFSRQQTSLHAKFSLRVRSRADTRVVRDQVTAGPKGAHLLYVEMKGQVPAY